MKNRFLFPHSYRRIGWLLFVPFLVDAINEFVTTNPDIVKNISTPK